MYKPPIYLLLYPLPRPVARRAQGNVPPLLPPKRETHFLSPRRRKRRKWKEWKEKMKERRKKGRKIPSNPIFRNKHYVQRIIFLQIKETLSAFWKKLFGNFYFYSVLRNDRLGEAAICTSSLYGEFFSSNSRFEKSKDYYSWAFFDL